MAHPSRQSGFTLAEIIIVFAIIGLLSSFMLGASFINTRNKARDSQRKTDLRNLALILEEYFNDYNRYPASNNGQIQACGPTGNSDCPWGQSFTDQNGTVYMDFLPEDPSASGGGTRQYFYRTNATGMAWQLYAAFEDETNPELDRNDNGSYSPATDGYAFVDCGIGYCNYGISSGNASPADNPL